MLRVSNSSVQGYLATEIVCGLSTEIKSIDDRFATPTRKSNFVDPAL